MNKVTTKLIASLLALIVAASLIVVSTYAWLTLSAEPEVGGIKIQIGGSNTILLAADVVVNNGDGTVSHYPGTFSRELRFSDYATYDYLQSLGSLTPVSTTDGIHWVRADFYTEDDPLVQQGLAVAGQMKDYTQLPVDSTLQYANLAASNQTRNGSYAYVDFWVVSPTDNCNLRVSSNNESDTGSFVIGQMNPVQNADGTGYALQEGDVTAAASVRVGFLANQEYASYADIQKYTGSDDYNDDYAYLLGRYQEPGEPTSQYEAVRNRFTIYEPNGNLHKDGSDHYQITRPLRVQNGMIAPADISDRLTVQLTNYWKMTPGNDQSMLAREFYVATYGMQSKFDGTAELADYFYNRHLQGALAPFVDKGYFVNSTKNLYADADANGLVDGSSVALHTADGATDEVTIIKLQKNVPQRIRMFIWLEGQDADCVNFEDLSNFIINLEFAGSEK
ncbi:MAG: hypothetical protein E7439_03920 [Ruminococcaceae bacterium]|nr:hypothetical protein [Oscillospiraceae bacterium]